MIRISLLQLDARECRPFEQRLEPGIGVQPVDESLPAVLEGELRFDLVGDLDTWRQAGGQWVLGQYAAANPCSVVIAA